MKLHKPYLRYHDSHYTVFTTDGYWVGFDNEYEMATVYFRGERAKYDTELYLIEFSRNLENSIMFGYRTVQIEDNSGVYKTGDMINIEGIERIKI